MSDRWPRLLDSDQVDEYTGVSRRTWGEDARFPKPVHPRGKLSRWDRLEIDAWVEILKAERDTEAGIAKDAAAAVLGRRLRSARPSDAA